MRLTDFTELYAVPGENHIIDGINPQTGLTFINGDDESAVLARHPNAQRMTWDAWQAERAERQHTPILWDKTTAEHYEEMLCVLPPLEWNKGAFLVGEPDDHDITNGQPRYRAYRKLHGEYYVSSRPMTRAELREIING